MCLLDTNIVSKRRLALRMNAATFRLWAKLMHRKSDMLNEDAMITACALTHKLTVVTRNVRDFDRFDVPAFNPFGY